MKYQRHLVQHNYTDHAKDSDDVVRCHNHHIHHHAGGVKEPFPVKLHSMLQSEESLENGDSRGCGGGAVVRWMPHGRAFIVFDPVSYTES